MASVTMQLPSGAASASTSASSSPAYPAFRRISPGSGSGPPSITRNASTCSSASTSSTSSSLVAAPMRPPPIETRTAATLPGQLPSRPGSAEPTSNSGRNQSRAPIRNGPRARGNPNGPESPFIGASPLTIGVDQGTPERPRTAPILDPSPTTPRAPKWIPSVERDTSRPAPRVTISQEPFSPEKQIPAPSGAEGSNRARRDGQWSTPSSPVDRKSPRGKQRTLSVDGRSGVTADDQRERRISQASAGSGSSAGARKPSIKDFILGEELGRGSYSTVVQATSALHSSASPRPPRQYAIKIINQAHLVAEKKVKYAIIERDALIRLAQPSSTRGDRKASGVPSAHAAILNDASRRKSNASINTVTTRIREVPLGAQGQNRLSTATDGSGSSNCSAPLSPTMNINIKGRRPSRSAEPPEMVLERSEEHALHSPTDTSRSRPPSPVREESAETTPPQVSKPSMDDSPAITTAPPTPDPDGQKRSRRNRRQSLAASERSTKSPRSQPYAHPGIIRLHSTFNDQTSLYFVLELAKNGELLGYIRKYGSLEIVSARYYAAQLIDTIDFMQEREVIHRDLKPENILLDENMRIKITDFGSAKIVGKDAKVPESGSKRSFVGSADFVSPEVLRSEAAGFASDIWAFGCILYQLFVGKPPFRAATDYLTFQKILRREFEWPSDIDSEAKDLVDIVLNVEPEDRPSPSAIKEHPFFAEIDWGTLWLSPAPPIATGIQKPLQNSTKTGSDTDVWAVFDDEVSDGGFEYDDADGPEVDLDRTRTTEPTFDRAAAAEAVHYVDKPRQGSHGDFEPPRPAFVEDQRRKDRKDRKWSTGSRSMRTSSSSSNNRTALSGLLETMGIHSPGAPGGQSNGHSASPSMNGTSIRSGVTRGEAGPVTGHGKPEASRPTSSAEARTRWNSMLLANENVIFASPVAVRTSSSSTGSGFLPTFLLPAPKSRHLVLTDFPRLVEIKDAKEDGVAPKIKHEALLVGPTGPASDRRQSRAGSSDGAQCVTDVTEKGSKGFMIITAASSLLYTTETSEMRDRWIKAIAEVSGKGSAL